MRPEHSMYIPDERFTCQSCGRCCTMWTITLDEAKAMQLRKHSWGVKDPFLRRNKGERDAYRIRMVDGRCFFLDENHRCRIHSELGYEAKPDGCKAFPLHVAQVAGQNRLRLSFYCPAVTAGQGKRLSDQIRWIKETVRTSGDVSRQNPLMLDAHHPLTLTELEKIEAVLASLLKKTTYPLPARLAAGLAVIKRLQQEGQGEGSEVAHSKKKSSLMQVLQSVQSADFHRLAEEGRRGGSVAHAGPIFSLFLGQDCAPGTLARMGHFFRVRLFQVGLVCLRSHLLQAKASRRAIQKVTLDPPLVVDELLTRYLLHKLHGRRTLMGNLSFQAGFNLLVTAYGMVDLLSRLHAAAQDHLTCQEEDVIKAVQTTDLLVVEHTTLYQGSLLGSLTEAVLEQAELGPSILARSWYPSKPEPL